MVILIVLDNVEMLVHILTPPLLETLCGRSRRRSLGGPRGPLRDATMTDFLGKKCFFALWNIHVWGGVDYLCNELQLPNINAMRPYFIDAISRAPGVPHPLTNCSLAASWKSTIVSPAEGILVLVSSHPTLSIAGACRWHCPGDLMHDGDVGVVQYFVGSILEEL